MKKCRGFSILEVLIASGIFTIVILGISQTVLLMHRYARANLCQTQAHLYAVSWLEHRLYNMSAEEFDNEMKYLNSISNNAINGQISVYAEDDLNMAIEVDVQNSPLYTDYGTKTRTEINPPEGFQSIRLKYSWASPLAKDIADSTTWPSSELYAIRPITPDDPPSDE